MRIIPVPALEGNNTATRSRPCATYHDKRSEYYCFVCVSVCRCVFVCKSVAKWKMKIGRSISFLTFMFLKKCALSFISTRSLAPLAPLALALLSLHLSNALA